MKIDISMENIDIYKSDFSEMGPIMIFCNPNAGYYEFMYYEVKFNKKYKKNH